MPLMSQRITAHDLRRLSVEACRDPRSVRKVVDGDHDVRSCVRASVVAAAARLGIELRLTEAIPAVAQHG
jgi:hypothetical protein